VEQRAALPKATAASIPVKIKAHTRHVDVRMAGAFLPETLKHEEIVIPVLRPSACALSRARNGR